MPRWSEGAPTVLLPTRLPYATLLIIFSRGEVRRSPAPSDSLVALAWSTRAAVRAEVRSGWTAVTPFGFAPTPASSKGNG